MLNDVIRTTLVEFGDRVRGFAPNVLAMLVVLLVGTLAAGAVRFALAYRRGVLPREQLLRSLVPLYLGRTASFVLATAESSAEEVEAAIQALADEFVRQKADLCDRW